MMARSMHAHGAQVRLDMQMVGTKHNTTCTTRQMHASTENNLPRGAGGWGRPADQLGVDAVVATAPGSKGELLGTCKGQTHAARTNSTHNTAVGRVHGAAHLHRGQLDLGAGGQGAAGRQLGVDGDQQVSGGLELQCIPERRLKGPSCW